MNPSTLLLAVLVSCCAISAHAEGGPSEPAPAVEPAPVIEIDLLGTGEDAAALADGNGAGAAAAIIAVKQVLVGNRLVQDGIHGLTEIQNSFNDNTGILVVNQDAGNFNNQANVVAFVMGSGESVAQVLSLSIEVEKRDNVVISSNSQHDARIDTSFNHTTGIVGVNQSAGSGNNQINAVAVGVGVVLGADAIVLQDTDLDTVMSDEEPSGGPDSGHPSVVDSFQGFRGVAQVSQANGNLNAVRNVVSVSVTVVGGAQP
jgi:hypothetical protein